ncbi:hypothetical protein Tco_1163228 [Tanacetum coccineum]
MASHRLNPLYAIKECSSCGSLYTRECCSIGSLENKILVPEPDSSPCCAKCGTPVDGPYCRGCALLRKKFKEDLLTYCFENGIFQSQDTFESSDDNTNVINALQEPIVVNQDPGVKSSQGPPLINQNCCYECGNSLDGIFCQQCICKFDGKGAYYGYNCPLKVPIISNPEQCNQTIAELPQTLPIVHPTCNSGNKNSFTYDSKPNSFNDSPSILTHPPQIQFETYLCELCGNNAHYGYDCPPQFPFSIINTSLLKMIFSTLKTSLLEAIDTICDMVGQIMQKKEEERRIVEEQAAKEDMSIEEMRHEQQLVDYQIKDITNDLGYKDLRLERLMKNTERFIPPDLPIKEPDNSLSMGDEHLDTTSSNENLVPIPCEFEGISNDTSDVPNCNNNCINVESDLVESLINHDSSIVYSSKIDPILEEFAGELAHIAPIPPGIVEANFDPNDDTSSDDNSFENIEYVDASPSYSELVSLEKVNDVDQEEKEFDLEDILQIQDVNLCKRLLK